MGWNRPKLTLPQILAWADQHHARFHRWPQAYTGRVLGNLNENWRSIDNALRLGLRGLPGGSSLARFLDEKRGVPNKQNLPRLTEAKILAWAMSLRERTGRWPRVTSGPVAESPNEDWHDIDTALALGVRGLPGGDTLARLLARQVGKRNRMALPPLTEEQILAWADDYHERTGAWPRIASGRIGDGTGTTWAAVHAALQQGHRGLPGGSSLAGLLAQHRGVRPRLTQKKILAWARAHYRLRGRWPSADSGPIVGQPGETWNGISQALRNGSRGLRGGSSLSRLLHERAGVPVGKGRRVRD